jgi:hypothetical protein
MTNNPTTPHHDEAARQLRHRVRGILHGLKLCVAALDGDLTPSEAAEFLTDVEGSAEQLAQLMDDVDEMTPRAVTG